MVKITLPGRQILQAAALLLSVACTAKAGPESAGAALESLDASAGQPALAVGWRTGLAIYGVDPVAYFSQGRVVEGRGAWELRHSGAVWRFSNEGNRQAFKADPLVYMPRFGGNDPTALARGVVLIGNPRIWVLFADRLYLFHTVPARAAFLADPHATIARAEARTAPAPREPADHPYPISDSAAESPQAMNPAIRNPDWLSP